MENKKLDFTGLIIPLGTLALGWYAVSNVLQALGIIKSDQAAANDAQLLPGTPFSPTFWDEYKGKKLLLTEGAADAYAQDIYNSVHALWFNEPSVFISIMQSMKTKTQVSFLCFRFALRYGKSLLSYLSEYLTPSQIAVGTAIANALPNYLP
jgi:hypothetical protein